MFSVLLDFISVDPIPDSFVSTMISPAGGADLRCQVLLSSYED